MAQTQKQVYTRQDVSVSYTVQGVVCSAMVADDWGCEYLRSALYICFPVAKAVRHFVDCLNGKEA